jgi:hypothetical protein
MPHFRKTVTKIIKNRCGKNNERKITMPYADLTFAEEYFSDRAYTDNWQNAAESDKQRFLGMATKLIEDFCQFYDEIGAPFLFSIDGAPEWLKKACCEEALYLLNLGKDPTQPDEVTVMGIASTKGTTFDRSMKADILCVSCRRIIEANGGEIDSAAVTASGGIGSGVIVK